MEANTQMFNTQVFHTAEPLSFPDSFFSPVDDFGDPFENQHAPGPSVNQVHSHEPPPNPRVKRRKVETRKVIKVPVPAESSDAEFVVPSDVWSWRKYGQKPIKGSPYPRGYYKCSSSKNCTAQKQVERSQTDRSMIIVTYISEHNHPCPTQKNPNVSKRKTLCNSIDSTSNDTINNRTTASVVSTPVVVAAAAKSVVFSAKIDETVTGEFKGVELENIVTSSISEGHELDQVFENIGVDPLMGAMDGWDEIFPCFRGLDSNGLNISNDFFDDEWRID